MKIKELKLGKEIVAILSDEEGSQVRGGTNVTGLGGCSASIVMCCSNNGCLSADSCICGGDGGRSENPYSCGNTYDYCNR